MGAGQFVPIDSHADQLALYPKFLGQFKTYAQLKEERRAARSTAQAA